MGFDPKEIQRAMELQKARAAGGAKPADPAPAGGRVVLKGPALNKTEQRYQRRLQLLQQANRILRFRAKPFKLRLSHDRQYEPDFEATRLDGKIVVVEIKGHLRDDARDKFKDAVQAWPEFDFLMIREAKGGGWTVIMRSEGALDL